MYQDFFNLQSMPFSLTPNPHFFCQLKSHQEALNVLLFCISSGEGFIKIIGEVGSGKTLLCKKLLTQLKADYFTIYIPNPDLTPIELRKTIARELGLEPTVLQDQNVLLSAINQRLIALRKENKKIVLLIDEAQALKDDSLETLRLLTNLIAETHQLIQVVLFAQPELEKRLSKSSLRQLKQRISFSYTLTTMSKSDLDMYLNHRLAVAGYTYGDLFTKKARRLLYKFSKGIPRNVNILAHKALLFAYGRGEHKINPQAIRVAFADTIGNASNTKIMKSITLDLLIVVTFLTIVVMLYLGYLR